MYLFSGKREGGCEEKSCTRHTLFLDSSPLIFLVSIVSLVLIPLVPSLILVSGS